MPPTTLRGTFVLAWAAAACGADAPTREAAIRDSAGVTIVDSPSPAWGDASPWQVDTVPSLSIGDPEGADPYQFNTITGAVRRDDGSIVVGDFWARELRLFDAQGVHLRSAGRRGPGPGEFSGLQRLARCGADELWVDSGSRLSVWDLDSLTFRREFLLPDNAMWPLTCFEGAGLLVQQSRGIDPDAVPPNTPYSDSLLFKIVDAAGAPRTTLFTIPLWQYMMVMTPEGGRGFVHPFSPTAVVRSNGDRLVLGLAADLRLDEYDLDGRLVRSLRGPTDDLTLNDGWRERYRTAPLTRQDSMTREWFTIGGSPFPDRVPAYTDLIRDTEGHLWVRRFAVPQLGENSWGVFGADGRFLGHIALPRGLEIFEIGRDYVLGITRDEDGLPQVRVHRLTRAP